MAYAAITCLMRTIQQSIQLTGFNLQSFYEKIESLRANLEKSSWKTAGDHLEDLTRLEAEIIELACSAEDMVDAESRKVILAKDEITDFKELEFLLKQEVERIDSAMNKWMIMAEQNMFMTKNKDLLEEAQNSTIASTSSSQHALEPDENMMVGNENEFEMMRDQLARGAKELKVVSIVGMGGIGKTTLANKLYGDPFIMSHFDIRAKATISQEYCTENVLLGLLSCVSGKSSQEFDEQQDDGKLADQLQKLLKCGRYLVVIDDIWTTQAWDDIKLCFPDCNNGSRMLMTTRNMDVAKYASSGNTPYQMRLLDFERSWNLLHRKVFDKECFSHKFEEIGKQIALKCGGLPLAITVIAGLLSKIGKSLGEWQSVAASVSSLVSTDVDAQCMKVLALSYHHLPHHLKPCFLYFAIFPEDEVIFVDKLMELWVVEGFLKVEETKSVEEVAEKCLKDLIDRSLISIHSSSFDKKLESCRMHDVTRELCLREARNVNFVNVIRQENDQNPCSQSMSFSSKSRGRVSIQLIYMSDRVIEEKLARYPNNAVCSVICFRMLRTMPKLLCFKLLRVLDLALVNCGAFPGGIIDLIHLRYLTLTVSPGVERSLGEEIPSSIDIPPSISSLCYLQTLMLDITHSKQREQKCPLILPLQILTMMQLRYLLLDWNYFRFHEPTEKSLVLRNLQYLYGWNPWYCTKSVFRLFPNLRKLQIHGVKEDYCSCMVPYDFQYLDQLEELEFHLYCNYLPVSPFFLGSTPSDYLRFTGREQPLPTINHFRPLVLPPADAFPQNLKKLAFSMTFLRWKDLSIVGQLPKLEALKLEYGACVGEEWEVVEEGFPCLKFLCLEDLNLEYWRASCDHFPCLEQLFLEGCQYLDSIPRDFADITTLALIDIRRCAGSVESSAKHIQQDIEENYAGSIEVRIHDPIKL